MLINPQAIQAGLGVAGVVVPWTRAAVAKATPIPHDDIAIRGLSLVAAHMASKSIVDSIEKNNISRHMFEMPSVESEAIVDNVWEKLETISELSSPMMSPWASATQDVMNSVVFPGGRVMEGPTQSPQDKGIIQDPSKHKDKLIVKNTR